MKKLFSLVHRKFYEYGYDKPRMFLFGVFLLTVYFLSIYHVGWISRNQLLVMLPLTVLFLRFFPSIFPERRKETEEK